MMEIKRRLNFSVPLKHLSSVWKTLDISFIHCDVFLTLAFYKNCVITDETTRDADPNVNPPVLEIRAPTCVTFKKTDAKLHVPVVTLSTGHFNKLLKQLTADFKGTFKCTKYRSEISNQAKTNNLNYLIDTTFNKNNRLFVLPFENENNTTSFWEYYTPKVEIKDFNDLIGGKSFFDVPIKNKQEIYEKIIEMNKNNDYTTGNLLDYDYFSNQSKLIAINLSKQTELKNPDLKQQINFIGKLKESDGATMFFIIEKSAETTFNFSKKSVSIM